MAGSIAPIASIGVPREIKPDERRVALTPDAVRELVSHGLQVRIEQGAGQAAGYPDAEYEGKGARLADRTELRSLLGTISLSGLAGYIAYFLILIPVLVSALNALAHAVEALYAPDRNPLTSSLALQGAQALITAVPKVLEKLNNLEARADCQYGGFLCGLVLGQVGMGLHHKLCHTLGGSFGLPHAQTHAVILPHAVAYNEAAVPDLLAPLARILNAPSAGQGLYALAQSLNAPQSLRDLGLAEADLDRAADLATQSPYPNPRPLEKPALRALLQAAWEGHPPKPRGNHG